MPKAKPAPPDSSPGRSAVVQTGSAAVASPSVTTNSWVYDAAVEAISAEDDGRCSATTRSCRRLRIPVARMLPGADPEAISVRPRSANYRSYSNSAIAD